MFNFLFDFLLKSQNAQHKSFSICTSNMNPLLNIFLSFFCWINVFTSRKHKQERKKNVQHQHNININTTVWQSRSRENKRVYYINHVYCVYEIPVFRCLQKRVNILLSLQFANCTKWSRQIWMLSSIELKLERVMPLVWRIWLNVYILPRQTLFYSASLLSICICSVSFLSLSCKCV